MLNLKKMVYDLPQVKEPSQARKVFKHDLSMKLK